MHSSAPNELPSDIWRLVAIECLDDRRTLFRMLLVSKTMFQTVVPVLYSNLPETIEPFRDAQRLEWLLGFSSGLYTVDRPPMTAKEDDETWMSFTTPLTADYYSFVKIMNETWLLQPMGMLQVTGPDHETANAATKQIRSKESAFWTMWVEKYAEKIQRLTVAVDSGWTPELDLSRMNAIVDRFKSLKDLQINVPSMDSNGQTSRWETSNERGQTYYDDLVQFVVAHCTLFPGRLVDIDATDPMLFSIPSVPSFIEKLRRDIKDSGLESQPGGKIVRISCEQAHTVDMTLVQMATSLTVYGRKKSDENIISALLQNVGPQLENLEVSYNCDDWLAWARTTSDENNRARIQKEWQANDNDYSIFERSQADIAVEDGVGFLDGSVPSLSLISPQHRPLFPKLKNLILNGYQPIPILDAVSIFRDSLCSLEIGTHGRNIQNGLDHVGWSWRLPKLESLTVLDGMNVALDSLHREFCPNLRFLSLTTFKRQNGVEFRTLGRDALRSMKQLEELSLSDNFENHRASNMPLEEEDEYTQDCWNITKADGFHFPFLRKVTCFGRWAVWIQGGFMAVAPRLEILKLDTSDKGLPKVLDVASFYEHSAQGDLQLLGRPFMRFIELKNWTIKESQQQVFEQIFVPLTNNTFVMCPRLWKVDLQYISGLDPNRLIQILMRQSSEMRRVRVRASGELDLTLDDFCLRWDPEVMPCRPIPKTMKEMWDEAQAIIHRLLGELLHSNEMPPNEAEVTDRVEAKSVEFTKAESDAKEIVHTVDAQQFSFSGLRSTVGQCVLHYRGFQYVLYSKA